jgi:hypothetical protein
VRGVRDRAGRSIPEQLNPSLSLQSSAGQGAGCWAGARTARGRRLGSLDPLLPPAPPLFLDKGGSLRTSSRWSPPQQPPTTRCHRQRGMRSQDAHSRLSVTFDAESTKRLPITRLDAREEHTNISIPQIPPAEQCTSHRSHSASSTVDIKFLGHQCARTVAFFLAYTRARRVAGQRQ